MENKLKSLKVAELRSLLSQASVHVPPRSNKSDLIALILSNHDAVQKTGELYPEVAQQLQPADQTEDTVAEPDITIPESKAEEEDTSTSVTLPTPSTTSEPASVEPEEEKRRKRAERFGIPVVEAKAPRTQARTPRATQTAVDLGKLKAREDRFGLKEVEKTSKRKRTEIVAEQVDPDELEKRKKRAERFGTA